MFSFQLRNKLQSFVSVQQLALIAPVGQRGLNTLQQCSASSKTDTPQPHTSTHHKWTELSWERDYSLWHALFALHIPQTSSNRSGWLMNEQCKQNCPILVQIGSPLGPLHLLPSPYRSFPFIHPCFPACHPLLISHLLVLPFAQILSPSSSLIITS